MRHLKTGHRKLFSLEMEYPHLNNSLKSQDCLSMCTLESGIVVPVGIIVLVGIFVKINKRTGWNKRTGGNYHQTKYTDV